MATPGGGPQRTNDIARPDRGEQRRTTTDGLSPKWGSGGRLPRVLHDRWYGPATAFDWSAASCGPHPSVGIDLAGLDVVDAHRRPNNTAGVKATQIRLHQMTSDNLSVPGRYIQAPGLSRPCAPLVSPHPTSERIWIGGQRTYFASFAFFAGAAQDTGLAPSASERSCLEAARSALASLGIPPNSFGGARRHLSPGPLVTTQEPRYRDGSWRRFPQSALS